MNTVNVPKPTQKIPFIILLGVLLVGIPLTVLALQSQQIFQQFAWSTTQSAKTVCPVDGSGAIVEVSFTNTESSKSMDVVAKDIQSGKFIDLGTVKPKETKEGQINTESTTLEKGSVQFNLKWTDGSSGIDTRLASYEKLEECDTPPPFCPTNPGSNEGVCKWETLEGAEGYEVVVKDTENGKTIKAESLPKTATQSAFPMVPGKSYSCEVNPINACGKGEVAKSPDKVCTIPTPSVSPTPQVCPAPPNKLGVCKWDPLEGAGEYKIVVKDSKSGETVKEGTVKSPDNKFDFPADPAKTYQCLVTAVNKCGEAPPAESPPISCTLPTPTPTTPLPTPTPTTPPATPTPTQPAPTPTPTAPPPTATPPPLPTPTPIVIVRIPPNTLPPQTQPPVVIQQPPVVVQQPPQQVIVQQQPPAVGAPQQPVVQQPTIAPGQPTPAPTMKPTGSFSNSVMLAGATTILLLVGSFVFFLL